jgi:hypothetical protein
LYPGLGLEHTDLTGWNKNPGLRSKTARLDQTAFQGTTMLKNKSVIVRAVLALICLPAAFSLQAQTPEVAGEQVSPPSIEILEQQSREAFAEGDAQRAFEVNQMLHERRPFEGDYMYNIVRATALMDRKSVAYEMMLHMQRQGLSYDFNQIDDTLNIRKTQVYSYLNDLMIEAGQPVGEATLAFSLAGSPQDFQAMTWDDSRKKFLLGTAHLGIVLAVAMDGSSEELLRANDENGLWSINGLAADPENNRLWISSAATEKFSGFVPTDSNVAALFEFNLETLELVGRYLLPIDEHPHELGSLALTDDGHVYVVDRASPIVYRKKPDGGYLEAFVANWNLESFSDVAVTPDNSRVFVADRMQGVFVVDPIANQAAELGAAENLNLGGIEGIEYSMGQLVIVQGGIKPQRLMRLALSANGVAVESVAPMAVALQAFDRPGIGVLQGDSVYYFANTGAGDSDDGVVILRTPLDAGDNIVPPDIRNLQKTLEGHQQ